MMSIIDITNEKVFRMINNPAARYDLVVSVGNDPNECIIRIIYNGDEIYLGRMTSESVRMLMNKMHNGDVTIARYRGESEIWTDEIMLCNAMEHVNSFIYRVNVAHGLVRPYPEQADVQKEPEPVAEESGPNIEPTTEEKTKLTVTD